MGSVGDEAEASVPAYPGEDTRPTSRRELLGFYTYSFAAEVFVVCGLGAFIPITLEDLARSSPTAVLAKDHSKPCKATPIEVSSNALNVFTASKHEKGTQCIFLIFGKEVNVRKMMGRTLPAAWAHC
jgi:MFS transporter, UMF1 family